MIVKCRSRDNGRQRAFFEDGDYALYLDLRAAAAERAHVEIWLTV
jgi:putative transposase